jgi:putative ABC transport system substrate-binding protein
MRRREFLGAIGSAAAWPTAARARQPKMPVIGYLSGWLPGDAPEYLAYFRRGLAEIGYTEGGNVAQTLKLGWIFAGVELSRYIAAISAQV